MTMSDQLARHARSRGAEVALVLGDVRRTYRECDERVSRLADALRVRGVKSGDRVVLFTLNALEAIETYFAVARLGAVCVPANFRLAADELAYMLDDSGASAVVVHGPLVETMRTAREAIGHTGPCLVYGGVLDDAEGGGATQDPQDAEDYEQALLAASADPGETEVQEDTPAIIMYTSGTTGRPKGAVLTHRNLVMHAFSDAVNQGLAPGDRVLLVATPLFHIGALSSLLTNLLVGGRTVVLPSGRFDPVAVVDVLEAERVSACFLVPTQWQAVCGLPGIGRRDLSALRNIGWGAAPATTTFLRTLIDTFPHADVTTTYGQTECSGMLTLLRGADALRKIGSVGTPVPNVEVRVVDERMNDVPCGEIGEFVYRGPMVSAGYWNKPEATAEVFAGGWFHSGDLVRQDDEGYFYIVDRKKDMIISGGENIYCAEVEDVLAAHPKVREAALIAVPDEKWGETPLAVVAAATEDDPPTPADLLAWCADRLARYKHPRHIAVVPLLPRNPSGKVLKTLLRSDREAGRLDIRSL
ncbi:long-chain-fatty-acid--CoA ligase [Streptomyces cylindrosporus]|uniref:Long-chain-fatty-acid--CoA ligase n=1 Tax=Streptomyces cylindrosporus TaxID=2927583 RepID=A0ABS9Y8A2_9ACTN|nr:long-chain-fatty-acid--CoA ligase [Streptomyces cylindrosporus]MCI3273450.1 long-chain-fatty-acid--CoA ligase [Streptomyces cylindrosporus]